MRRSLRDRRAAVRTAGGILVLALAGACAEGGGTGVVDLPGFDIENVGFMTPESVLHDSVADVYLVSNINGGPVDKDDNGFISRVSPEGEVLELKWIDGPAITADLHAPKGMAIRGDSLFVADIDCVRIFHRETGEAVERICMEGTATFLNDLAVGPDGSIYVTDSGLGPSFEPTGTDAVYRLVLGAGGVHQTVARGADLGGPNGVAVGSRGIFVGTFGSGEILSYSAPGVEPMRVHPRSNRQIDGIVFLNDGGFAFTSWGDSAVYRVSLATGRVEAIIKGLDGPADLGYDATRNRLLIPVFNQDKVLIRELTPPGSTTGS